MIHAVIHGNLGADAETQVASTGTQMLKLRVACPHGFGDRQTTTWVKVTMFGARGGKIREYLKKGQAVVVRGELFQSSWENREGVTQYTVELIADEISFAGSKPSSDGVKSGAMPDDRRPTPVDDDIPF